MGGQPGDLRIGIDFDNTIVGYSSIIHEVAVQRGLIDRSFRKEKKDIRDRIRRLPDGENEWQKVQGVVYGPRMGEAELMEGVAGFLDACRQHPTEVYIVSHKTEYARFDATGTNLRSAAAAWMEEKGFFAEEGLGLSRRDVFFESTRGQKIERIRDLRCTHFIDDLEEVFAEDSFPDPVEKILYFPQFQGAPLPGIRVARTWDEIGEILFHARV